MVTRHLELRLHLGIWSETIMICLQKALVFSSCCNLPGKLSGAASCQPQLSMRMFAGWRRHRDIRAAGGPER